MSVSPSDLAVTIAVALLATLAIWVRLRIYLIRARRRVVRDDDSPGTGRDPRRQDPAE